MKKLLAVVLISLLAACVSPPPVSTPNDAIGQGYELVRDVSLSVASAQRSGAIDQFTATDLKEKLQEAHDLLDAAALAPAGSTEANEALSRAQGTINLIRVYLSHQGASQ
jgi:hypothetical protein